MRYENAYSRHWRKVERPPQTKSGQWWSRWHNLVIMAVIIVPANIILIWYLLNV